MFFIISTTPVGSYVWFVGGTYQAEQYWEHQDVSPTHKKQTKWQWTVDYGWTMARSYRT